MAIFTARKQPINEDLIEFANCPSTAFKLLLHGQTNPEVFSRAHTDALLILQGLEQIPGYAQRAEIITKVDGFYHQLTAMVIANRECQVNWSVTGDKFIDALKEFYRLKVLRYH